MPPKLLCPLFFTSHNSGNDLGVRKKYLNFKIENLLGWIKGKVSLNEQKARVRKYYKDNFKLSNTNLNLKLANSITMAVLGYLLKRIDMNNLNQSVNYPFMWIKYILVATWLLKFV